MITNDQLLTSLKGFIKNRETSLQKDIDEEGCERLFESFIKPLLKKEKSQNGVTPLLQSSMSKDELEIFMGEMFALSMYNKHDSISEWHYSPKLPDGKTPDFIINDSKLIEIYSPRFDNAEKNMKNYIPEMKNNIGAVVAEKSLSYKDFELIILVHMFVNSDKENIVNSINNATLASDKHSVVFLYGDEKVLPQTETLKLMV